MDDPQCDPSDDDCVVTVPLPTLVSDDVVLERGLLIALFIVMWIFLLFPFLYDIILTTVHLVVTFTPKPNEVGDDLKYMTIHYEYFMENKYDPYQA